MKQCPPRRVKKQHEQRVKTLRQRLAKAQRVVRKYVAANVSLADELIVERREAARYE